LQKTSVHYYFKEGKEISEYVVGKQTGQELALNTRVELFYNIMKVTILPC
jgi:hypothetical protein